MKDEKGQEVQTNKTEFQENQKELCENIKYVPNQKKTPKIYMTKKAIVW